MTSRREKTAQLKELRKSRTIIVAAIVAAVVVLLGAVFLFSSNSKRDITEIENVIPDTAGIVFISDTNETAWKYFNALAGSNTPIPRNAEKIGYSNINQSNTLYFSIAGDKAQDTELFLKDNKIPFLKKDNVYAVTADENRLSDTSLGKNKEYLDEATKGHNESFGYINFPKITEIGLPSELELFLPSAGKWYGEFKDGKWIGSVSGLDYSKADAVRAAEAVFSNITIRAITDGIENEGKENPKGTIAISDINDLAKESFETSIQKIDFEIKGERLSFTLK